jgi:hypothetical protein
MFGRATLWHYWSRNDHWGGENAAKPYSSEFTGGAKGRLLVYANFVTTK